MSMSFKASPDGTYGEILVNGQAVAKLPVSGNAVIPNLVGTVSQSGGIPTGAVVERGSNANGEYVRFADGTQICQFSLSSTSVSDETIWTFPASFSTITTSTLIVIGQVNTSSPTINYAVQMNNPAPTHCGVMVYAHNTTGVIARSSAGARVTAIGRWY